MKKLHNLLLTKRWYSQWHGHKHVNATHYAVLLFVLITSSVTTLAGIVEVLRVNSATTKMVAENSQKAATPQVTRTFPVGLLPTDSTSVIVKFSKDVGSQKRNEIAATEKLSLKKDIPQLNIQVFQVDENDTVQEIIDRLKVRGKKQIEFAEMDKIVYPSYIPNDPSFPNQWHLSKIGATAAWDSVKGDGVTIAILDSGVDCSQPELAASCVPGWNVPSNNSDTTDIHGHGTAVSSTAAEIGDNGFAYAGVAYKAKIMPIRITNDPTNGYASCSDIARGITWAADHGVKIASNSYYVIGCVDTVTVAANYLASKGGIYVRAAGNGTNNDKIAVQLSDPNDENIVVVSATDSNDAKTSWSNYGTPVDLAAPGEPISCIWKGVYGNCWGTSFSVPIVSAVLALEYSKNPNLTQSQARSILYSSADDIGTPGWDPYYGWGRVNAAKAVMLASSTQAPTPDTKAPSVPSNFTSSNLTSNQVKLSWGASVDNVLVTQYVLYKNGTKLTSTTGLSFTDTTLMPQTGYNYTVSARDAAGNESAQSSSVSVTTPATPLLVSSYSVGAKTASSAKVSWSTNKATAGYVRYGKSASSLILQASSTVASGTSHSVSLSGLTSRTTYYYQIVATSPTEQAVSPVSSFKTTNR